MLPVRSHIDAQLLDDSLRDLAVRSWALDRKCSAKPQAKSITDVEFVALGMPTEIVVVVENQDARFLACCFAIEVRRGESADPSADNDQIVALTGINRRARRIPESAVPQCVRRIKRSWMTAAHSSQDRRIIGRRFFRLRIFAEQTPRHQCRTRRHRNAVQEVAAADLAVHPNSWSRELLTIF